VRSFGWSNGFTVPAGVSGVVRISYSGEWMRIAWVLAGGALLALASAMAFAARMPTTKEPGPLPPPPARTERPPALAGSRVRIVPAGAPPGGHPRGGP